MPPVTTTSGLPPAVQQTLGQRMLSVPTPNMISNIAAERDRMPKQGGSIRRRRRYNPLATAMVPLGNTGAPIPAQLQTVVDIDAKIQFYGTYVELNEQVPLQAQEPVLNEIVRRLGVSLRQTEDQLTRDMLAAAAGFVNSVGGVSGDNPTEIERSDIDSVARALQSADGKTIIDFIELEDRFGNGPVRDSYVAMCSTDLTPDLQRVEGFVHKRQYPSADRVLRSEYGTIGDFRFFVSSIGSTIPNGSALGATVYNIFCCAMEAYSYIEQDGYSSQLIYRPPVYEGPLAQNATIAYKFGAAPLILNDLWVIALRATLLV
jgi:N4-gp56 family major capsid protein